MTSETEALTVPLPTAITDSGGKSPESKENYSNSKRVVDNYNKNMMCKLVVMIMINKKLSIS